MEVSQRNVKEIKDKDSAQIKELEEAFNKLMENIGERFMESMTSVEAFVTARSAVDIFSTEILEASCILTSSGKLYCVIGHLNSSQTDQIE